MVVQSRLFSFDRSLEEAAYNLGANRAEVLWFITLKYLRPSIIGGAAVAFLMSFENFNTTLFLVGSESTIPITLYLQVRDGSTPVINAISFILILTSSVIALTNLFMPEMVEVRGVSAGLNVGTEQLVKSMQYLEKATGKTGDGAFYNAIEALAKIEDAGGIDAKVVTPRDQATSLAKVFTDARSPSSRTPAAF